jgi:hypothetical protein
VQGTITIDAAPLYCLRSEEGFLNSPGQQSHALLARRYYNDDGSRTSCFGVDRPSEPELHMLASNRRSGIILLAMAANLFEHLRVDFKPAPFGTLGRSCDLREAQSVLGQSDPAADDTFRYHEQGPCRSYCLKRYTSGPPASHQLFLRTSRQC